MWTCRNAALALLLTLLSTSVFAQGAFLAGTPTPQATSLTAIPASARIVFHTNQVIYTMDAAGGNITQITYVSGRALDHIAVSPDRKRVVASYVLDGLEKLVLFDLDAGTEVLLVPYFYRAGYGGVDWDLAGNIYFVGIEDLPYPTPTTTAENQANAAAFDVYRVKYDGTQVQRITSTTDHGEADVSVSADGTLITYVSSITTGGTTSEVWTNTIAGTAPHLVYNEPLPTTRSVHDPELSPDNTKVVFSRVNPAFHNFPAGPNTAHDLYKINVNGTGLTLITTPGPISILPDWKDTSIVYLELSDEAVDYLGVSTISDTGTGKVRINGNAASPKWIETATVPTVPPPIAAAPPPANLRVQKLSWSVYPNPANDAAIVTAAAYLGNTTGEATAMTKLLAAGGDVAPRYLKWRDVEANLGVYDFTKIDALVATSGELPLVVNFAPIWDDGSTSIPTGLAFTTFGDPAVVLAYQNMLTAAVAHLKGRLYALIVGSEVDTYLTTDSRRAQYAAFLQQVRGFARTKFGTNPFLVTTSLRSTVTSTWADWAGIASVVDLNAFTYYPDSTPETFGPRIVADLQHLAALGSFMLPEVGISVTAIGEEVQSAEMQALTGIIGVIADTSHRIPIVIFAGLSDVSAAVLADFGYSSGQLTAGMGLRTTANAGKVGYVTLCGSFGGTNCADLVAPAPTCTFTLAAASDTFTASLGSDTVALTASDAGCAWTRQLLDGAPSWLTVTPASGTGNATITYGVTANTDSASRSARFTIGDGDIFTITQAGATPPDPDPDPDPVISCNSTTASPTGRTPLVSWTPCRQDTWNRMYACYLLNPANPPSGMQTGGLDCGDGLGGKWMKLQIANCAGGRYYDIGQYGSFCYQVTGNAAYAAQAYTALFAFDSDANGTPNWGPRQTRPEGAELDPALALGTPIPRCDGNEPREDLVRRVRVLDWIRPTLTPSQLLAARDQLALDIDCTIRGGFVSYAVAHRIVDSDQTVGLYFGVVLFHLANPDYAPATVLYNNVIVGGLTPSLTVDNFYFHLPIASGGNMRNAIAQYVALAAGGEWPESPFYNVGTLKLLLEGVDGVRTLTGVDYFPEVTAWLPLLGKRMVAYPTPDLHQSFQWGDEQDAHGEHVGEGTFPTKFAWSSLAMEVAGLLQGTADGRRVQSQLQEMIAQYGAIGWNTMEPSSQAANPFVFYNPYDLPTNWRLSRDFFARGVGILSTRSNAVSLTTDSQFFAWLGGAKRYTVGGTKGTDLDHMNLGVGDWGLYRNGAWAITRPYGYLGPDYGREGQNSPLIHGFNGALEFSGGYHAVFNPTFRYVTSTTGGSLYGDDAYAQPTDVPIDEVTEEKIYLPTPTVGGIDTVLIHDRFNVPAVVPGQVSPFYATSGLGGTCGIAPYSNTVTRYAALSPTVFVLHANTLPVRVGSTFTWTTAGSETAKLTTLFPASNLGAQIVDERTLIPATAEDAGCFNNWTQVYPAERKFHIRTWDSGTYTPFHTMLHVVQVGGSGTLTALEDPGKVRGVHLTRAGASDVVALFNAETGGTLHPTGFHPSHSSTLPSIAYRGTGFTRSWTAVASSTLLILTKLNPTAAWTINIDGAGAVAITACSAADLGTDCLTSGGVYSTTISGAGAHTITTVGSGAAPPPDPVSCPTIVLSPTTLPSGTTGTLYSQILSASGGTGPYTFTYLPGSAPITGTTLDSDGNPLAGTPTIAGDYTFTVQAAQAGGCVGTQSYTVTIAGAVTSGTLARTGTPQSIADFTGSASLVQGSVTMGAGSNRLAIVELEGGASDTATGCTYNGVSMTEIAKTASDLWLRAYRLVAPATGANTLRCAFSSVTGTMLVATFHGYTGVDQTTPIDVFTAFSSGNYTTGVGTSTAVQGTVTTTKTNTWTVMATRSWGAPAAGLASTLVANCCGLGVFDGGPWALPGSKTMEATFPSPIFWNGIMFAINPAP